MTMEVPDRWLFKPKRVQRVKGAKPEAGDPRRNPVYVYDDHIVLGVNVALATRRPLLVRGKPGSGKSSLAPNVAETLGWRYNDMVVTSRTQGDDLLWSVDLLQRLHEAQAKRKFDASFHRFVRPGVLWWAFDYESAFRFAPEAERDPRHDQRAVVLIDEIDKAEPDVPNGLLVPFGSLEFTVRETGTEVTTDVASAPLIFITTNNERQLPAAFLRRCVELELQLPNLEGLADIGKAHFTKMPKALIRRIARLLIQHGEGLEDERDVDADTENNTVSTAEFLDTLRAAEELDIEADGKLWDELVEITIWKTAGSRDGR